MDLEPIEERANEFSTWVGKFDLAHSIPAAFASAADVPGLVEEVKRLTAEVQERDEWLHETAALLPEGFDGDEWEGEVIARFIRQAARPAPAWDEEAVRAEVDREALRRFVDSFCDDEAGEVEHVVSADGTSGFALTGGNDAHAVLRKAASALWPGESRATVQAEALREAERAANHDWLAFKSIWGSSPSDQATLAFANKALDWLRARAASLAAEGGADRG